MDLTKVSRNDWIVVGGFIVALVGISMHWYSVGAGCISFSAGSGWDYGLGVFVFILTLVAAALALSRAFAPSFKLPVPLALAIMVLGGLSTVFVIIRIIDKPGGGIVKVGYGIGIFVTLIGAAAVTLGGFLKNSESAH
jgi:hypothetical protein